MKKPSIPDELWMHPDKIEQGKRMIAIAVKMYKPRKVWALCSGGNDSLCSTHLAMSTGLCDGVASINTTIGIQETRDHLTKVCDKFGWPLKWLFPTYTYAELCGKFGMPGPGGHALVYNRLKLHCIGRLARYERSKKTDKIMVISGCRLNESVRRMNNALPITREGRLIWCAPIINWDDEDKTVYQINNRIPRNPVTPVLGISGECLCGAFAKPGEREKIRESFPDAESQIVAAEHAAASNNKPCAWGTRPPKRQQHLCQQCDRKN